MYFFQELVREINLTTKEVYATMVAAQEIGEELRAVPDDNYEAFRSTKDRKISSDSMEVSFAVADGVSGAQNALPETQNDAHYSQRELALLKEVDAR